MTADSQPDRVPAERTNPLDGWFILCATVLLTTVATVFSTWGALRFVQPKPVDTRAVYAEGAFDMCAYFGTSAGAPPEQIKSVCDELTVALAAELD